MHAPAPAGRPARRCRDIAWSLRVKRSPFRSGQGVHTCPWGSSWSANGRYPGASVSRRAPDRRNPCRGGAVLCRPRRPRQLMGSGQERLEVRAGEGDDTGGVGGVGGDGVTATDTQAVAGRTRRPPVPQEERLPERSRVCGGMGAANATSPVRRSAHRTVTRMVPVAISLRPARAVTRAALRGRRYRYLRRGRIGAV